MNLPTVPPLDDLLRDPASVSGLPLAVRHALLAQTTTLASTIAATLTVEPQAAYDGPDELLTAEQVVARWPGVFSVDWLYRHSRTLPFARKPSPGRTRFSSYGVQAYLAERTETPRRRRIVRRPPHVVQTA